MGHHQTQRLLSCEENLQQDKKKTLTEWEDIFANDISDEGLISKYIRNSYNSITKKMNNPIQHWAEDTNMTISKEDIQMANGHM